MCKWILLAIKHLKGEAEKSTIITLLTTQILHSFECSEYCCLNHFCYCRSRIVTQDEYVLMTKLDGTADQKAAMLAEKPLQVSICRILMFQYKKPLFPKYSP